MNLLAWARRALSDLHVRTATPLDPAEARAAVAFLADVARLGTLGSAEEWCGACTVARWMGMPLHHDLPKTWDTLKSFFYILQLGEPGAPVLDAGSGARSAILGCLRRAGYNRLYACDVRPVRRWRYAAWGVRFSIQDLTRTTYPDAFFQAVTAISVIEHGIPLEPYLQEMARILRPGGLLLTSTDYWPEPIDCSGIYPYGEAMGEMKVFQREELEALCRSAAEQGLDVCAEPDWTATRTVVRWDRVDREYTYTFLAMRKRALPA